MTDKPELEPEVTYYGFLDMQICVPIDMSDEDVRAAARRLYPCGTSAGWQILREGDPALGGYPERAPCKGPNAREGFVHIVLDA